MNLKNCHDCRIELIKYIMEAEDLTKYVLFGTLKLKGKKKIYIRKDCVFLITDKKHKEEEIIEILDYKIIGKKNKSKGFTEVKASNETRNKITGAYE